jgi:hypothetical protein
MVGVIINKSIIRHLTSRSGHQCLGHGGLRDDVPTLSLGKMTKGKEVIIGEERLSRMIKSKSPKDGQWQKNEGAKPQCRPKATFDIPMAKYKQGRASIRGHENWTIRNPKLDCSVSLSQASSSTTETSSDK